MRFGGAIGALGGRASVVTAAASSSSPSSPDELSGLSREASSLLADVAERASVPLSEVDERRDDILAARLAWNLDGRASTSPKKNSENFSLTMLAAATACCVVVCVRDCGRVCRARVPFTIRRQLTALFRRAVGLPMGRAAYPKHTRYRMVECVGSLARIPKSKLATASRGTP